MELFRLIALRRVCGSSLPKMKLETMRKLGRAEASAQKELVADLSPSPPLAFPDRIDPFGQPSFAGRMTYPFGPLWG